MLRVLFVLFIAFHGLIHLMGFAKAFGWAQFEQLTQDISRPKGILWLSAAVLIATAALLFLFKQAWWWMPGLLGALLSQVLIVMFWGDARFGTIPNVLLLLVAVLGFGAWNFKQMVRSERDAFWPAKTVAPEVVRTDQLATLPRPVQGWLKKVGVPGKAMAENIRLRQTGEMRTAPDGKWMGFEAEQWFTTQEPEFLWYARVGKGSPVRLNGMDRLLNGKGHMLIKLFGLISIVDSKGPTIDQGTLLRYLAEIIWFPSAALADYIDWEPIDDHRARATLTYGDLSVNGTFTFNDAGQAVAFEALRYYDQNGKSTLEAWHIDIEEESYREFEGVSIPTRSAVSWKLEEGDFLWLKLEIVDYKAS